MFYFTVKVLNCRQTCFKSKHSLRLLFITVKHAKIRFFPCFTAIARGAHNKSIFHLSKNYFYIFYTSLISSHHCSNDVNNNKFIIIDICASYVFLSILVRRSPIGVTARLGDGHRWPPHSHGQVEWRSPVTPTQARPSWAPVTGDPHGIQRVKHAMNRVMRLRAIRVPLETREGDI